MYSVEIHKQSAQLQAFTKLCSSKDEYWKVALASIFNFPITMLPKINLHYSHVKRILRPKCTLPLFWMQVLHTWAKIQLP